MKRCDWEESGTVGIFQVILCTELQLQNKLLSTLRVTTAGRELRQFIVYALERGRRIRGVLEHNQVELVDNVRNL